MTIKQEIRLKMYRAVRDFLLQNEAITKDLPEFKPTFAEFLKQIDEIQLIDEKLNGVKTGITKDKLSLKVTLTNVAAENSRKVLAYAKNTRNQELMDEVDYSHSDLKKLTDVKLRSYTESLFKRIETELASLEKYGINSNTQKTFSEALQAFDAAIPRPRLSVAEKGKMILQIRTYFDTANEAIKKIDIILGIIRNDQVNFYNGYRTVRKLVDTNAGIVSLKAVATEFLTKEPVRGAVFTFTPDSMTAGDGVTVIQKRTKEKGGFLLKNIKPGSYKVTISKPGYKDKILTISVTGVERSDLVVEMEKT